MNTTKNQLGYIFQIDLSDMVVGEDYWLQADGKKYPLIAHTPATLAEALKQQPALKPMPGGKITHYNGDPVVLNLGAVLRISVRHTNNTGKLPGDYGVHLVAMHVVENNDGNLTLVKKNAPVIAAHPIDYVSTAKSLLFHHADLATSVTQYASCIMNHMDQFMAPATYLLIQQMATQMRTAGPPTKTTGWANYQDYNAGTLGIKQTLVPTNNTLQNASAAMSALLNSTKNDVSLQATPTSVGSGTWSQETGTSVENTASQGQNSSELIGQLTTSGNNASWSVTLSNTNQVDGLQTSVSVIDSTTNQIQITMCNYNVCWLGAYIQFVDADGNIMDSTGWGPDDGGTAKDIADHLDVNYSDLRFIGTIQPINTFMAIPISADPGTLIVNVTFPSGAVSANLFGCGIGTGSDTYAKAPVIGGVLTGFANLGIPVFFLGFQVAAQSYKPLYLIVNDKSFLKVVIALGATYFAAEFGKGGKTSNMNWHAFSSLTQILFSAGATKALVWAELQIVEGKIEDEIPFAGWLMLIINTVSTLAQMAETIVAIATSPWMIQNSISTTITSTLTVNPDPRHLAFPAAHSVANYVAKMIYKDQNRPAITLGPVALTPGSYPATITPAFTNNTLGGKVMFQFYFYTDGWLAGSASTSWIENNELDASAVTMYLCELPIPLSSTSVYQHSAILGYESSAYTWMQQTTPPTGTLADANTSQSGNAISVWSGLALSQRYGMIGSAWKAAGMGITDCTSGAGGQLFAFQNIDIPGLAMNSEAFPSCGFTQPSQLVYDVFPQKFLMQHGQFVIGANGLPEPDTSVPSLGDYYIDPRKSGNDPTDDGGYHLRQVELSGSSVTFNMAALQNSYGRFPYYPDSITLHPSGHAIGVNQQYCKLMITALAPAGGAADDEVPLAHAFAGQALNYNGSNGRAGLLFTPVAVTCSYDGTILVLEQLSSAGLNIARIQAFDLNGNPVSCFEDASQNSSPFLILPDAVTYLDMAAVGDSHNTYIYVLYYSGNGTAVSDYSMSIYQYGDTAPQGSLLVTTPGVPAAKINVDMWHTLYTLNYQMTQNSTGSNAGPAGGTGVGPAGITVPSVSEWLPPTP